jgi:hypothetical protein
VRASSYRQAENDLYRSLRSRKWVREMAIEVLELEGAEGHPVFEKDCFGLENFLILEWRDAKESQPIALKPRRSRPA